MRRVLRAVLHGSSCPRRHVGTTRRSLRGSGLTLSTLLSTAPASLSSLPSSSSSWRHPTACLQLNLPPLWTWAKSCDAAALCEDLAAYVEMVQHERHPPSALLLRMYPDATVARLTRQGSATSPARGRAGGKEGGRRSGRAAAHRLSLNAFVHAEHPWGSDVDGSPHAILESALTRLEHVLLPRFASVPIVLILPTRMLVTQSFCEKLMRMVSRQGNGADGHPLVGIAFEMPPNPVLFEPEERQPGTDPLAVAFSWARLSLLTTPWESLLRCDRHAEALAKPLRHHLTRNTVMPLHVLLPWMAQQRMCAATEVALVADTILPTLGYAFQRAVHEGPDLFATGTAQAVSSAAPDAWRKDSTGLSVYMGDRHATTRDGKGSARAHEAATAALRAREQRRRAEAAEQDGDLASLTTAMRCATPRARDGAWSPAPPSPSSADSDGGLLTLDAPPDSLKRLILETVTPDRPTSAEDQQKTLYEQFGKLVSKTFAVDNATARDGAAVESPKTLEDDLQRLEELLSAAEREASPAKTFAELQAAMEKELSALHRSGGPSDARDARTGEEHEQSTAATLRKWTAATDTDSTASSDLGHPLAEPHWRAARGYWACLLTLHAKLHGGGSAAAPLNVITMPTLHAEQVQAWCEGFRGHGGCSAGQVVPVLMPLLSPTELDLQRQTREAARRSGDSLPPSHTATRWLPQTVQTALQETLSQLPARYRQTERQHAIREQRRARGDAAANDEEEEGGVGGAAPFSTVLFGSGSDDEVVIRRRHVARRPLWYGRPDRIAVERSARLRSALAEEKGREGVEAIDANGVEAVCRHFKEGAMLDAISGFSRQWEGPAVGIAVPCPGCSRDDLAQAWRTLDE